MTKKLNLLFVLFALLLASCDNDEGFEMVTKKSYLLAKDSVTNKHEILKISDNTAINWAVPLSSNGILGDICGKNNVFWVSDIQNKEIIQLNAFDESKEKTFQTTIIPHYICVGESHLIVCDTIAKKIDYIELKNAKSQIFSLDEAPMLPTAANHKFYVKEGTKNLGIYDETNFGKRENILFKHKIADIQVDVNVQVGVWVQTSKNDTIYQSCISLLFDAFSYPNRFREELAISPYTKKRYSPYSNKSFGKETLIPVSIYKGKISLLAGEKNITDFEIDFFDSNIYYLKAGQIYRYNINQKKTNQLGAFSGSFLKSYFYIDSQNAKKTK